MPARLVAHRGHAAAFPENSAAAVESALAVGADDVEVDIQLTRDELPVLYHDETLDRVSGIPGSLLDVTGSEATELPAHEPSRFGDQFAGTTITPLSALPPILAQHASAQLFAEIKEESLRHHTRQTLVDTVTQTLTDLSNRVIILSYDPEILELARKTYHRIGLVIRRYDSKHQTTLAELAPEIAIVNHTKVGDTPLWPGPWQWMIYEISTPELATKWHQQGASYLETKAVQLIDKNRPQRP